MPITDEFNDFMSAVSVATTLRQKANEAATGMLDSERHLLYEAIFLRMYRAYENLLENVFISYLIGEQTIGGVQINSHVRPIDRDHARALVTSSQPFLDWTSPQVVIKRADTYIIGGDPIRTAIAGSQSHLQQAKKIRNHIAHNSTESAKDFNSIIVHFLLTAPLAAISAGEFLAYTPTSGPCARREILSFFLEKLESTARALVA
ncbi:hypothetical protein [Pseudomonas viridiflava]|uniref:hypothetical protein n=1 Tax=Pseudomonas viridiflava TaxID=33069 RepID=UPI000F06F065|nr:hypothetical protein [Pseudomonas viridiflava]